MLHIMAYNKDRDSYNELALADNYEQIEPNISAWREMLKNEELKDEAGEPYDWLEVWDEVWDYKATEETNKALVQWLKENGRMED